MSKSMRRLPITLVAAAFVAAATALAGPAGADPPKGLAARATCSDGNSYDVVVPGNASYPPAHIVTSTQVFKPVAFGGFTTTVIAPDGSVIATETTEAITQGGGNVVAHNPKSYLECTVTFGLVTPEGLTVSVTGTVTGFFTSRG